ncbi:hypothetical protein D3C78_1767800 [compost metagenome]
MRARIRANSSIHRKNIHRCTKTVSALQNAIANRPPSKVEPISSRAASRALVVELCWPRLTALSTMGM